MKRLMNELDTAAIHDDPVTLKVFKKELEDILCFADSFARLISEFNQFETKLVQAQASNEFIDVTTARVLFVTATALFRVCQTNPAAEFVPFALAAISYFLEDHDGKNDFVELDGFDDDNVVLTLVIKHFKLEESVEKETAAMKLAEEIQSA